VFAGAEKHVGVRRGAELAAAEGWTAWIDYLKTRLAAGLTRQGGDRSCSLTGTKPVGRRGGKGHSPALVTLRPRTCRRERISALTDGTEGTAIGTACRTRIRKRTRAVFRAIGRPSRRQVRRHGRGRSKHAWAELRAMLTRARHTLALCRAGQPAFRSGAAGVMNFLSRAGADAPRRVLPHARWSAIIMSSGGSLYGVAAVKPSGGLDPCPACVGVVLLSPSANQPHARRAEGFWPVPGDFLGPDKRVRTKAATAEGTVWQTDVFDA